LFLINSTCNGDLQKHYIRGGKNLWSVIKIFILQNIILIHINKYIKQIYILSTKDSPFQIKKRHLRPFLKNFYYSKMRANLKPFALIFAAFLLLFILADSQVQSSPVGESKHLRRRPCCESCQDPETPRGDWCDRVCMPCNLKHIWVNVITGIYYNKRIYSIGYYIY
jgi:hypothetical protein